MELKKISEVLGVIRKSGIELSIKQAEKIREILADSSEIKLTQLSTSGECTPTEKLNPGEITCDSCLFLREKEYFNEEKFRYHCSLLNSVVAGTETGHDEISWNNEENKVLAKEKIRNTIGT